MQAQLDQIVKAFNSAQDEWNAEHIPSSNLIQTWKIKEDDYYAHNIVLITDFLLHWNDHEFAKVVFGFKMVCKLCGYPFKTEYFMCGCMGDNKVLDSWIEPAWIFRLKRAFRKELEGGLEGLIKYFCDNLRGE